MPLVVRAHDADGGIGVPALQITRALATTLVLSLCMTAMAGPLHPLFERDVDGPGGIESAINSYPSLADFLAGTNFTCRFSSTNVNAPYSVRGFLIEPDGERSRSRQRSRGPAIPPPSRNPPRSLLLATAMAALFGSRRTYRQCPAGRQEGHPVAAR